MSSENVNQPLTESANIDPFQTAMGVRLGASLVTVCVCAGEFVGNTTEWALGVSVCLCVLGVEVTSYRHNI